MKKLGPAFTVDQTLGRSISLGDIAFGCVGAFLVFPVTAAGLGFVMLWLADTFSAARDHPMVTFAKFILGVGFSGLFAWVGAPVAMLIGWAASRRGWIGWGAAPLIGSIAGAICGLIFFGFETVWNAPFFLPMMAMFMAYGAIYAVAGWISLRWLRADIFKN